MYLNNLHLYKEIVISKAMGKLTPAAEKMLIAIGKNAIRKFYYYNPEDKHDCMQHGMMMMFKFWYNFDEVKSTNPFSYFTEIFKRGAAAGYNELYKKVDGEYIFYNSLDFTDESGNIMSRL